MSRIHTPVFRPDLHVEIVPGEALFLLSETELNMLSGAVYAKAGELLDGKLSFDDVSMKLARALGNISLAEAYFVMENLAQKGLVIDVSQPPSKSSILFGIGEVPAIPRSVSLHSLSKHDDALREALEKSNIAIEESAPLQVVLVDSYSDRRLGKVNKAQLKKKQPWMLAKIVGKIIWLGPIFNPENGSCYECLAQRLRANREVETFIEGQDPKRNFLPLSKDSLPSTLAMAAEMVVVEVERWLHNPATSPLIDNVRTLTLLDMNVQNHLVQRRPQCKACGHPRKLGKTPPPPKLEHHLKRFTEEGGHRTVTPEETLAKYSQHISPVSGIVNSLSRLTPTDNLIHSYHAGHNSANHYQNLMALQRGLRSKAGGKGKTDIQAKVSGLCEAMERYSGVFEGYEPRISSSLTDLGELGIHPNVVTHFSETQYANQDKWNQYVGGFHTVPKPYNPDDVLEWSPVWSMTEQRYKYLPTAYLYFNYVRDKTNFVTWADSNGNASGNTLEEAILQAFFELVERDCVAVWWYNRLSMPGVDLAAFGDPWIQQLIDQHKSYNREVWALDLTNDLGIPAFAALTRRTDKPVEDILLGFGAHFDPKLALQRALTEINQFMPAVMDIPVTGKAEYKFDDPHILHWWKKATIENQPYLLPSKTVAPMRLADYTVLRNDDILDDVLACQKIVEAKGLEMLLHVQTRPDLGMPVAKVIVPGLRHFWARFAPGRLYDVPVQMGWLPSQLTEAQLNPIPMFI